MKSFIRPAVALALIAASAIAQSSKDERDLGASGAMSVEQLRRASIVPELDIPYAATDDPRQRLDLYLPANRAGARLPVIVFIHGGGWSQGDKSDGARNLMPFVRTGRYAGVSVGYRLTDTAQWPAQIHDCKAAIRWVRANAGRYGLDAERIGVWGKSAGAHLALMCGLTGDAQELEGDLGPHTGVKSSVAAVADFYGPTDLLVMVDQPSAVNRSGPDCPEALLIGGTVRDNPIKARAASPVSYITPDDPPILIVHGTQDRTVPYEQAVGLNQALLKAGVKGYFITIKGAGHGDFGLAANDRLTAFFDTYLCGIKADISTAAMEWKRR